MNEAYEGELEWLRSKVLELDKLQIQLDVIVDIHRTELNHLKAEIEALKLALIRATAENAQLNDQIKTCRELREYDRKDIERLTSERNDYEAEGRRHIKTIAELRHENARLLKDYATDSANQRLLSENERLQAELTQAQAQVRRVVGR